MSEENTSLFILDSDILEGYPSIYGQNPPAHSFFNPIEQYMNLFKSNLECDSSKLDGYPSIRTVPDPLKSYYHMIDFFDLLFKSNMEVLSDKMDGYPIIQSTGEAKTYGAFSNIPSLEKVKIPKSVKYIADFSFYNTKISEVTIAEDCIYYEHSFPDDCVINFYD